MKILTINSSSLMMIWFLKIILLEINMQNKEIYILQMPKITDSAELLPITSKLILMSKQVLINHNYSRGALMMLRSGKNFKVLWGLMEELCRNPKNNLQMQIFYSHHKINRKRWLLIQRSIINTFQPLKITRATLVMNLLIIYQEASKGHNQRLSQFLRFIVQKK